MEHAMAPDGSVVVVETPEGSHTLTGIERAAFEAASGVATFYGPDGAWAWSTATSNFEVQVDGSLPIDIEGESDSDTVTVYDDDFGMGSILAMAALKSRIEDPDSDAPRRRIFTNEFDCELSEEVTRISSITMRFPKVPSSDGRNWQYKVYQPGQPVYGNITFEGPVHGDTFGNIGSWVKEVYDGNEIREDITIRIRSQAADSPARTFNLISTFPTHLSCIDIGADGVAGSVQHWTLEVRVNRIEMA